MKSRIGHIRMLPIFLVFLVTSLSCVTTSRNTGYLKYTPSKNSLFNQITFEYPDTWNWEIYIEEPAIKFGMILASNPDSIEPYGGAVSVDFLSFESQSVAKSDMEASLAKYLERRSQLGDEVILDRFFEIDGYEARQITLKIGPSKASGELPAHGPAIADTVYILVENSYYRFNLNILESERQGEFGQGFDHMIETIQFLP